MKRRKMNPVDVFDIQNLPDVPFRRVLYFLSLKDTRKLRLVSKGFERRITFLKKSLFNKFYIKESRLEFNEGITKDNCEEINKALSVAMNKEHAPEKLELRFHGKLNPTMKQISLDYKDNISSLDINILDNVNLLLKPSFVFEGLESLSLNEKWYDDDTDRVDRDFYDDEKMKTVCKKMLKKHAHNLKSLKFEKLRRNLRFHALPKLESLFLYYVDEEASWTLLKQCRHTITSLYFEGKGLSSSSFSMDESNYSEAYQIPNIKLLSLKCCYAFKFVIFNAEHLVSLELGNLDSIPIYKEWPQFPNLRELIIDHPLLLPILMNCRETLECLVLLDISAPSDGDEYAGVIMPRLTDLYARGYSQFHDEFANKICSSNSRSLEFLCMNLNDSDGIRMERMRNVVLGDKYPNYTEQDRERIAEMCPNAEVDILREENNDEVIVGRKKNNDEIRDLIKSRCKRKNFSLDVAFYFE